MSTEVINVVVTDLTPLVIEISVEPQEPEVIEIEIGE